MKIALAQFNPTVGDFAGNSARIIELACEAKKRGADLAVFSELCLCGYPPQDLVERPVFAERNATELARLAKAIPMPSVVGYVGRGAGRYREAGSEFGGADRGRKNTLRAAQDAAADLRRV